MALRRFSFSMLIEFGPVTAFFLGALIWGFFVGVALLMATTVLATAYSLYRDKRVPLFSLIASFFVLLSGGATLFTHNPFWVALDYTVSNLIFGVVMIGGVWMGKAPLRPLFESMFSITEAGWRALSLRWGIFFLAAGVGSELMWRAFGYDTWVWYRFLMVIGMCVFGFSQFYLARRERLPDASPWGLRLAPMRAEPPAIPQQRPQHYNATR